MSTPFALFGPGILIGSRTDVTPGVAINVGYVQEFSLEASGSVKELFGQNQIALAAARGTIKLTGKFKSAVVSGIAMNALFWGGSMSTTSLVGWNIDSTFTTSTSSSALQVGSSLTYEVDLGVKYAASNLPLQRVSTGSEVTGKYSVTGGGQFGGTQTGTYNFAAADEGVAIKVTYTATSTAGQNLLFTNQLIGTTPTFQLDYYTNFDQPGSKPFAFRLYSAVAAKMAWGFKLEDFNIPEFDFNVFANNAGQVFNAIFPEVS